MQFAVLLLCFIYLLSDCDGSSPGIIGKPYAVQLVGNEHKTWSFNVSHNETMGLRINILGSGNTNKVNPLMVLAHQPGSVLSLQVPESLATKGGTHFTYRNVSRTICVTPDMTGKAVVLIVDLSWVAPSEDSITEINFVVYHTPPLAIAVEESRTFEAEPAQPILLYFEFKNASSLSNVLLSVTSPDSRCALLSVQPLECPVNDRESEIRTELGMFETFQGKAAMMLSSAKYKNESFYVLVLVKASDVDCDQSHTDVILTSRRYLQADQRRKTFTISVSKTITRNTYIIATSGTLVLFILIYGFALLMLCTYERNKMAKYRLDFINGRLTVDGESLLRGSPAASYGAIQADIPHHPAPDRPGSPSISAPAETAERLVTSGESDDYDKLPEVTTDRAYLRSKAQISVADLAQKKPSRVAKRYHQYFLNLIVICVFYGLPVVQLVVTYQWVLNDTGDQDICYYNFLCSHPLGVLSDFNHVFSNVGYILFGCLFLIIVAFRDRNLREFGEQLPQNPPVLGIPPYHGISYALGLGLVMEGIMSACYHVCPNATNFQFDTCFMYIISWLLLAKIYQTRHPDIGKESHMFYIMVAVVVMISTLGIMINNVIKYYLLAVVLVVGTVDLAAHFYYLGTLRWDFNIVRRVWWHFQMCFLSRSCWPSFPGRLLMVMGFTALNSAFAIFGVVTNPSDFDTFLLSIFISNLMLYTMFYCLMKLFHLEWLSPVTIFVILMTTACWTGAAYFFFNSATSWSKSAAHSRQLNQECLVANFYDTHDVWHFLSGAALFLSFLIVLAIDDHLLTKPRELIPVF